MKKYSKIVLVFFFGFIMLGSSGVVLPEAFAMAIIGNGDVIIGVDDEGQLNIPFTPVPELDFVSTSFGVIGLRDGTGEFRSTEDGCPCEGWGVAIPNLNIGAEANNAQGGAINMSLESFNGNNGDNSAISTVSVPGNNPVLTITHDYHPSSSSPYIYTVDVTFDNTSDEDMPSVIYRRAMDWDIYPTQFAEIVTIQGAESSSKLIAYGNDGFLDTNPLTTPPESRHTIFPLPSSNAPGDFIDLGPADHGAVFDFEVGPIAAGSSESIVIYYGVAPDTATAQTALGAVGAEVLSLGKSNVGGQPNNDSWVAMFGFGNVGGQVVFGGSSGNGGMNHWDTRPTFGVDHETREIQQVDSGFGWGDQFWTLDDNHHTEFELGTIEIGIENTFSAKVYASKGLKVQEFAWGIPVVGEAQNAEARVEVYYDNNLEIEDVKVVQDSLVIDPESISVSHEKALCLETSQEELCDQTNVKLTFLEPLQYNVAGIHAIDNALRDQWTFLNDGFEIAGESLNPMQTKMIPSNVKNQGLVEVTQLAKYSPYWQTGDGRMFEMNSFGSFKEINQDFKRFQDTGDARTRSHSGFGGILDYEQNRATQVFDSTKLISEVPDSFGYHFEMKERFNEQLMQDILQQQEIANSILEEMDKQSRHY